MGIDPLSIGGALAIGSMVTSAATAGMGIMSSIQQANAANAAADRNYKIAQQQEIFQQTAIANTEKQQAAEAVRTKSDQLARAHAELGSLKVMAGEMGTSGQTLGALTEQLGYTTSSDLSRVDSAYSSQQDQNALSRKGADLNYNATIDNIYNQTVSATTQARNSLVSSVMNGIGSELSIGTSATKEAKIMDLVSSPKKAA